MATLSGSSLDNNPFGQITDDFGYGNPGVRLGSRTQVKAESNPPSHSAACDCCGSDRSNKAPRPKRSSTFFDTGRGARKPGRFWWGDWRDGASGCCLFGDRLPDPPSHQAEKHPGKQGPEHQQYQHEQPSGNHSPLGQRLCLIGHEAPTGNQGHRQSRVVPGKLPPFAGRGFQPTRQQRKMRRHLSGGSGSGGAQSDRTVHR